jgi:hypothetical protein
VSTTPGPATGGVTVRRVALIAAPGALFLMILVVLHIRNATTEVYIDVVSSKFGFDVIGPADASGAVDLVSNLPVVSLQVTGASVIFAPTTVATASGALAWPRRREATVKPLDPGLPARVRFDRASSLQLRSLTVPAGSRVVLSREEDVVHLTVTPPEGADVQLPYGRLGLSDTLTISGQNVSIEGLQTPIDREVLAVTIDPRSRAAAFAGEGGALGLQLALGDDADERWGAMLGNLNAQRVRFQVVDRALTGVDRVRSGIVRGDVLIGGVDLLDRRFLLRTVELDQAEVLQLGTEDIYFVDAVELSDADLGVSLFSESASEIGTGKRSRFVRSVAPSVLDVIVAEPSKKTVWAALLFLLAQYGAIRKVLEPPPPKTEDGD